MSFPSSCFHLLSLTFISSCSVIFLFVLVLWSHPCTFPRNHLICLLIVAFQDSLATHTTPASTSPYQPAVLQPSTEPSPQVSQPYWISLRLPDPPLIGCCIVLEVDWRTATSLGTAPIHILLQLWRRTHSEHRESVQGDATNRKSQNLGGKKCVF